MVFERICPMEPPFSVRVPAMFSTFQPSSHNMQLLPAAAVYLTLLFGSATRVAGLPTGVGFGGSDKVVHVLIYGFLATLLMRAFRQPDGATPGIHPAKVILVATALGLAEECVQAGNPNRSFEWADLLADAIGATLAAISYRHWSRWRSFLEMPLPRTFRFPNGLKIA